MTALYEKWRPREWSDLVGQDKALAKINALRKRGLAGRAYWISGQSGTGKSSLARLIAAEIADEWSIEEIDAESLTPTRVADIERSCAMRSLGKGGRVLIINEAHGLRKTTVRQLLVTLGEDRIPAHACWIFTTTVDGQDSLFEDNEDAHPLLSRCQLFQLARRDLAKPFAERARKIAQAEGLDGQSIESYVKLMQKHRNNLRAAIQDIEAGCMSDGGAA